MFWNSLCKVPEAVVTNGLEREPSYSPLVTIAYQTGVKLTKIARWEKFFLIPDAMLKPYKFSVPVCEQGRGVTYPACLFRIVQ